MWRSGFPVTRNSQPDSAQLDPVNHFWQSFFNINFFFGWAFYCKYCIVATLYLIKIVFWYRNKTGLTAVTETLSPRKTKTALLYTKLEESFGFLGPENLTLYVYIKRELSAIGLWLGQEHDKNPPYGRLHSPRAAGWWFSEFHEQDL